MTTGIIYIIIFIYFAFLLGFGNDKLKTRGTYFAIFAIIVISGFRKDVGIDYQTYEFLYDGYKDNYLEVIEPAWQIINNGLHSIGLSYVGWTTLISILIIGLFSLGMKKMSTSIAFSFLLFCCTILLDTSFNAIRQYSAMAIIFGGTPSIFEKKYLRYYVYVAIALLFHNSALIAILFPLFIRKISPTIQIGLLLTTMLIGTTIMNYLLNNILPLAGSVLTSMGSQRDYSYDIFSIDNGISSGTLKYVYNLLAIGAIILCKKIKTPCNSVNLRFFLNAFVISICLYNVFYTFQVYRRLYEYGFMYITLLLPIIANYYPNTLIRRSVSACYCLLFLTFLLLSTWNTPYQMRFDLFT